MSRFLGSWFALGFRLNGLIHYLFIKTIWEKLNLLILWMRSGWSFVFDWYSCFWRILGDKFGWVDVVVGC